MSRGDEYETPTLEEALKAWDRYNNSASLLVGDDLWVFGSQRALARAQIYILANSTHPVERQDVNKYLAAELKNSEATVADLRGQIEVLQSQLREYKRFSRNT